jgi:DNA-binding LytR/AlgR family response regulator
MLKILIVEDDLLFAKELSAMLEKNPCKVVGVANKYEKAVELFDKLHPDFVFIDIELKGIKTGIDFANYMNETTRLPFIYLTRFYGSKYQEYFNKANDTNHYNFLTKLKVDEADIWHHVEVAVDKFRRENNLLIEGFDNGYVLRGNIYLKSKEYNTYQQVALSTIVYINYADPFCIVHTTKEQYFLRKSLTQVVQALQCAYILQISATHAVNVNFIKGVSKSESLLTVGSSFDVKIGRQYKNTLMKHLPQL